MTSKRPAWSALAEPLHAASAGLTTLGDRALVPLGFTFAQWRVLVALEGAGAARVSDLVEALAHDQAALSRLVARLEAAGLVRRVQVPGDARAARLLLTTRGELAVRAGRRRLASVLGRLTAPFSGTERAQLQGLLGRLSARIRAASGAPAP